MCSRGRGCHAALAPYVFAEPELGAWEETPSRACRRLSCRVLRGFLCGAEDPGRRREPLRLGLCLALVPTALRGQLTPAPSVPLAEPLDAEAALSPVKIQP